MSTLLAVPNISEGRDRRSIAAIAAAFEAGGAELVDTHSDPDHNRTVLTLAGAGEVLIESLLAGAARTIELLDIGGHRGAHPRVGVLDVVPIVHLRPQGRGAACAAALTVGDRLGDELQLPVFLYGALSGGRVTRAALRAGGAEALRARIESGELRPDFGPRLFHPSAGAALVAARAPLVAFNVELAPPATVETARAIAGLIREGGAEGLTGVRAIGLDLPARGTTQISTNVEDHRATPLAVLVAAISRHATPLRAELVGLAPAAAFDGFPADLEVANRRHLEDVLSD